LEIANRGGPLQSESLEELAATIPDDQIRTTLDQLAADQSSPAMMLVDFLARHWAANSPAEAAQWAATHLADNDVSHDVFGKIMVSWAEKDLVDAVAWVQQLPASGNKSAAAFSLASEAAARKEAMTAINLTASISPGPERDDLLNYAAQQWATTDRESAVAWINQIQDPALRESMLGKVAVNLGTQNPFAAAELIATSMGTGQVRDDAVVDVIRFWAPFASEKAAAWVDQFPESELRNAAMENLMDVWAKDDFSKAGAWLSELPKGPSRDAAVKAYAAILDTSTKEEHP